MLFAAICARCNQHQYVYCKQKQTKQTVEPVLGGHPKGEYL